jgi:hypothetical protein
MTDGATLADVLQVCRQCNATFGLAVRRPAVRQRLLARASAEERARAAAALQALIDTATALKTLMILQGIQSGGDLREGTSPSRRLFPSAVDGPSPTSVTLGAPSQNRVDTLPPPPYTRAAS